MEEKKMMLDTGEVVCGFGVRKNYEGQTDFDTTYKEITIKQRVKKVGEGENDFIIEEYEEVKEFPIQEVIDAQKDEVGIEAYLRPYTIAGVEPPAVEVSERVQDFTKFPDDSADAIKIGDQMMKEFYKLDPALRGNAKSPEEFLNNLTTERLTNWLKSKVNVEKGDKENGKK